MNPDTTPKLDPEMFREQCALEIKLNGATSQELWSNLLSLVTYAIDCKNKQSGHWPHMVSTDAGKITVKYKEESLLLPCPCGAEAHEAYIKTDEPGDHLGVVCNECSFQADSVIEWNTRAAPPLSAPVAAFARKMQEALDANMHKGTREEWRKRNPYFTSCNVSMQGGAMAVMVRYDPPRDFELSKFTRSAVNAAVYAMMATDSCGGLESEDKH